MTFKIWQNKFWKKIHCSLVSWINIVINFYLNGLKSCKTGLYSNELSKLTQRTRGILIFKEFCIWWTCFDRPIRDGFFGFSWRLVILDAEQIKRIPASGNEIEKVWNCYMHNERVELYGNLAKRKKHQPKKSDCWLIENKVINTSLFLGLFMQLCKYTLPVSFDPLVSLRRNI